MARYQVPLKYLQHYYVESEAQILFYLFIYINMYINMTLQY